MVVFVIMLRWQLPSASLSQLTSVWLRKILAINDEGIRRVPVATFSHDVQTEHKENKETCCSSLYELALCMTICLLSQSRRHHSRHRLQNEIDGYCRVFV
jgi:hypothetical protein